MSLFISFLVLLAALALQALFEGYEIGFISSNPISVRRLAEQERSERAARLLQWIETPDRLIATILVGANLMVVICTVVVSRMVETLVPVHLSEIVNNLISTLFLAPIMLIFVGIIPKSVFRTMPTRLSLAFLPAIQFFYRILAPVAIPFTWLVRGSLYLIGAEQRPIRPLVSSLEEVRDLVDESVGQGAIEPEEQEMIHSVIDLQDMTVKEIMVPRIAIQALPDTATRTELAKLFVETGRTRVAIYRETIDQIIGVVSAYALLRDEDPACEDIARFVKQVRHIPDTMKVGDLLREFKQHKQHMAIVTDEYGGTLENRMRYPLEVFHAVRAVWPAEKPISMRISAHDWLPDEGVDPAEAVEIARMLKAAGVDICDVSAGQTSIRARPVYGRMFQTPFSDRIRNEVGMPTMAVGNIFEADHANSILMAGRADLVCLARPHLADPCWTLHQAVKLNDRHVKWPDPYLPGRDQAYRLAERQEQMTGKV